MPSQRPSERWTSYEDWDYGTMKQRLESLMASLDKAALVDHVEAVLGSSVSMSEPFSAGQYWCCFECFALDGRLVIARVRLPRHPDSKASDDDEAYIMQCEAATMAFLRHSVTAVPFPTLYAYEAPGSARAAKAGAPYMLIEGFYGNLLQDVDHSVYNLPLETQDRILGQWTLFQAQLATFTFPQIGSISHFSEDSGPVIGPVAAAASDGLPNFGPFSSAKEYLSAVAKARLDRAINNNKDTTHLTRLGLFTFHDIVRSTDIFNHMDMGIQNLLVDDTLTIIAVIDWEMAQSAPWAVFYYPMPFPLLMADERIAEILADATHGAHRNTVKQHKTRDMYRAKFAGAEKALAEGGRPLLGSIAAVLAQESSRIYGIAEKIGVFDGMEEMLTRELVRLGYGLEGEAADRKLEELEVGLRGCVRARMCWEGSDGTDDRTVWEARSSGYHNVGA